MEFWYDILSYLPFEWALPGKMMFMKNALLAIIIVSPLFGLLSTMIVNNKMAFFSDALGHSVFTGMVIGAIAGLIEPIWCAIVFSVFLALLYTLIKAKSRLPSDIVIGVFSSISVALGIFIATFEGRSFSKLNKYLIGDLLSITPQEILELFIVFIVVAIVWILIFNRLLVLSIHNIIALSRGIKTFFIEAVFSSMIAITVTFSLNLVGLLVINSLLVLPGAISRNISNNVRKYHLVSIIIATLCGILGLIVSYSIGTSLGATIVLILGIVFISTFIGKKF